MKLGLRTHLQMTFSILLRQCLEICKLYCLILKINSDPEHPYKGFRLLFYLSMCAYSARICYIKPCITLLSNFRTFISIITYTTNINWESTCFTFNICYHDSWYMGANIEGKAHKLGIYVLYLQYLLPCTKSLFSYKVLLQLTLYSVHSILLQRHYLLQLILYGVFAYR